MNKLWLIVHARKPTRVASTCRGCIAPSSVSLPLVLVAFSLNIIVFPSHPSVSSHACVGSHDVFMCAGSIFIPASFGLQNTERRGSGLYLLSFLRVLTACPDGMEVVGARCMPRCSAGQIRSSGSCRSKCSSLFNALLVLCYSSFLSAIPYRTHRGARRSP